MSPAALTTAPGRVLTVFFDGGCPACSREMAMIARRDRHGRLEFVDIAAPEFDAGAWGREQPELMAAMHVRRADGRWAVGVEAFRQIYGAIGFGWLVAPTRLPGIRHLLDVAYRIFARHRTRLAGCDGRCSSGDAAPPRC